jgi:hypothetical protein
VSFALARLTVDFSSPWLPLAITGLFGVSIFYRYQRPDPYLCAVTEAAAQMLLILLFGILLTYAAMATNFSLSRRRALCDRSRAGFGPARLSRFRQQPAIAGRACRL